MKKQLNNAKGKQRLDDQDMSLEHDMLLEPLLQRNPEQEQLLAEYKSDLKEKLHKYLRKYQRRKDELHEGKPEKLTSERIVSALGGGVAAGAGVGTAIVPVLGTAVGAGVGLLVAAGVLGGVAAHSKYVEYENKQLANARKITAYLGDDRNAQAILDRAADKVIDERMDALVNRVRNNSSNKEKVVSYLAKNMMSALKYDMEQANDGERKSDLVAQGLWATRSKKASSKSLAVNDKHDSLTTKELVLCKPRR